MPQALFEASQTGKVAEVEAILKEKPELIFQTDSFGNTALHWCCAKGSLQVTRLLLSFSFYNNKSKDDGTNSNNNNDQENVKKLINGFINKAGETALALACSNNHYYIVKALMENGADPTIANHLNHNRTALFYAVSSFHITTLFLEQGICNVNRRDTFGNVPLHIAAIKDTKGEAVQALISKGADVTAKNTQGHTPLANAKANRNKVVIQILESYDAQLQNGSGGNSSTSNSNSSGSSGSTSIRNLSGETYKSENSTSSSKFFADDQGNNNSKNSSANSNSLLELQGSSDEYSLSRNAETSAGVYHMVHAGKSVTESHVFSELNSENNSLAGSPPSKALEALSPKEKQEAERVAALLSGDDNDDGDGSGGDFGGGGGGDFGGSGRLAHEDVVCFE